MTTGIDLILADHRRVDDLFARFDETGDATLVGQIFDALAAHDDAEQGALYPLARDVGVSVALLDDAALAHSHVKVLVDKARDQEGPGLVTAVAALHAAVGAHVAEEQRRLLPALGDRATPAQLDALAARINQIKQRAG